MPRPAHWAFTATAEGLPNVLQSPCKVGIAGRAAGAPKEEFTAIWDTGATHSAITQKVVERCGLQPTGRIQIRHAGIEEKPDETDTYLVNLGLPNNVIIESITVSRGGFSGGDVLIGMDIINTGDFAITHANGQSKFSFQLPPQADIDFVKEQPLPPARNRAERRSRKRRGN